MLVILLCVQGLPAWAAGNMLPTPADFRGKADAVVVLFSLPDCTFCERVRKQSLNHLEKDPAHKGRVRVFEIDFQDNTKRFVWFDGRAYTGWALAAPLNVKFSPTVMVFGRQGAVVSEPILGAGLPDFYNAYLNAAIEATLNYQN